MPSLAGLTASGGRLNVNGALHACTAPPDTPANLTARGADTRVTLTWSAALGAMRYNVKRSLTAGGPYDPLAPDVQGTSYIDTAVVNGATYYYVVSAENTLGESGDSNEASATPNIPPDMIVSALAAPAVAGPGSTIAVAVTSKNQGAGTAQPSTTRLYRSDNTTFDAADALLGEQAVPELAPGALATASLSLVIPEDTAVGRRYLIASADDDDLLDESNENNNRMSRSIQIGPDLVIIALTVPTTGAAGGTISVTDTMLNQGGGAAGGSRTSFYLSVNSTIGVGDVLLGGRDVPGVAASATSAGSTTLTIPTDTAVGTYYIIAKADADGAVSETYETNNTNTRLIKIGGDLVVSALTAPAKAGAGATITVTDTTANQGGGAAAASVTRFYLSSNATWDGADAPLGSGRQIPELAAAANSIGSTSLTIPSSTATGSYFILAKADADNIVPETIETNNVLACAIQVGGDLVVSAFTVPARGGAGLSMTVSDTTMNQGAGPVGPTVTKFYFSTNWSWDGADTLLGSRGIPELAAGAVSSGSTIVTIPSNAGAGVYYLIAKADADNAAVETQEANNILARGVTIGSDLAITGISTPTIKGAAGSSIVVSETVTNQGGGGAGTSVVRFYLSADGTLGAGDVLMEGNRLVPDLPAGASSAGSTSVTIPAGSAAGAFYIIAKADADNAVAETSETNNTRSRAISIGPDLIVTLVTVSSASVAAGTAVNVTDTVMNQGADTAASTNTRFYLSTNGLLDAGDVPLAPGRPVAEVAAGASSSGTTPVTIPANTTPGSYYVLAKADGDGVVGESLETNNVTARAIQVILAP